MNALIQYHPTFIFNSIQLNKVERDNDQVEITFDHIVVVADAVVSNNNFCIYKIQVLL